MHSSGVYYKNIFNKTFENILIPDVNAKLNFMRFHSIPLTRTELCITPKYTFFVIFLEGEDLNSLIIKSKKKGVISRI